MSDSASNNDGMQPRRSKRNLRKPQPATYSRMSGNDPLAPLRRVVDDGVDEAASDLGYDVRGAGQRLFDIANAVSSSEESSLSDIEDEEDVTGHHTILQQGLAAEETLSPHPTLRNKVIATLTITVPNTNVTYNQTEIIPELIPNTADAKTSPKDRTGYYFDPPISSVRFPKRSLQTTWAPSPTAPNTYIGTDSKGTTYTATPTVILRTFDSASNRYHAHYMNPSLLPMDPNNRAWKDKYQKWIYQIHSHKDPAYTKNPSYRPFSPAERRILYTCINEYIHEHGMAAFKAPEGREAFGPNRGVIKQAVYRAWVDKINEVSEVTRIVNSVRSQIGQVRKGEGSVLGSVLDRADAVRRRMETGGVDEWPEFAIPVELFPGDAEGEVEVEEEVEDGEEEGEVDEADVMDKGKKRRADDDDEYNSALSDEEIDAGPETVFRKKTNALVAKARALVEKESARVKKREQDGSGSGSGSGPSNEG